MDCQQIPIRNTVRVLEKGGAPEASAPFREFRGKVTNDVVSLLMYRESQNVTTTKNKHLKHRTSHENQRRRATGKPRDPLDECFLKFCKPFNYENMKSHDMQILECSNHYSAPSYYPRMITKRHLRSGH